MSGTSLDGLDIACCRFIEDSDSWEFFIEQAVTIEYTENWKNKLENAPNLTAYELISLHREYGVFIGNQVNEFVSKNRLKPMLIASHGHTVFHEPEKKLNFQIGDGASIAAVAGITTVSDFRSLDINLGGQGAPLVPIGDHYLFGAYDFCINLGGFANISHIEHDKSRIAYDICPVNIVLNKLANEAGYTYDKDGEFGRLGKVDNDLLKKLNGIKFYKQKPPKSLGKEWLDSVMMSILESSSISLNNKFRTYYEHIVNQIVECLNVKSNHAKALITGGGALNKFLIELLTNHTHVEIIIPEKKIIDYKEALIFAFLGVLRIKKQINCLKSVTGARIDNCGGQIFYIE